jgi:alpha-1,3-mannosyltransferase
VGFWHTIPYLGICAGLQIVLALPFLMTYPIDYLKGAFDFGRMFFFKWYVFILHACR